MLEEHKREEHVSFGRYLKDVIYAANDGIVTTFAVVAGVVGADLSLMVILIVGFANLIADGFAMATGNYLGTKSEKEFYQKEERREREEVKIMPEKEKEEVRQVLVKKGYAGEDLDKMVTLISSNEKFWVDFMMHEELQLFAPKLESPIKNAAATFFSFIFAGSIPLIPYIFPITGSSFSYAIAGSAVALFIVGAARKFFSNRSWLISGLEMLMVGGLAGTVAYLVGYFLKSILT